MIFHLKFMIIVAVIIIIKHLFSYAKKKISKESIPVSGWGWVSVAAEKRCYWLKIDQQKKNMIMINTQKVTNISLEWIIFFLFNFNSTESIFFFYKLFFSYFLNKRKIHCSDIWYMSKNLISFRSVLFCLHPFQV